MGFLAVLAACLFAVFIFTVFGGYSLLLWCQQSLWMVVPPALVLAAFIAFTRLYLYVHFPTDVLGGAVLGIALGYIVSMAANKLLPSLAGGTDITVSPSFNSIAAAFGISVFIGVLFGYLPAKRAARLNPIDALRYD